MQQSPSNFSLSELGLTPIRAHRTQMPGKGLRGAKNTIAVASGKGGVGKSTLAVNLSIALARAGARVGLLDADIYGPSIPLMIGQPAKKPLLQDNHYIPIQAHGIQTMSIGYLAADDSALIWRGPMLAKALIQLIDLTLWDDLDYLLIDLPPGTGDIQLSLVQKIPLTGAVIVTTPQTVATADAQKALHLFAKTNIHVFGLIENMSTHVCTQCGHQEAIFGTGGAQDLANRHSCPLLGQLPLNQHIQQDCDQGRPTCSYSVSETAQSANQIAAMQAFMQIAKNLALAINERPLNYAEKFSVTVK